MVKFKKFLKWLDNDFEETILILLLVVLSFVMMLQVIMRYVFGNSLSWPEEFCRYCFIYSGFFGIAYCVRKGKVLKVDVLINALPPVIRTVMNTVGEILSLALYVYFFYYSFEALAAATKSGAVSAAMSIPTNAIYFSVVLGFGLATLRQVQMLILKFGKKSKPEEKKAEVVE